MIGALRWVERGGQKRDCFGEYTSCRVAFEGKTVISPIVQSPGSDCQAVPRNPGSSISSGQTERSSHQKDFFLKIVRGVKFPWAAVGGQNGAGKVENVPTILIIMLLKYLFL